MTNKDELGLGELRSDMSRPELYAEIDELRDTVMLCARRLSEQSEALTSLIAERDGLREALDRQCDNMAFVLNRVNLHAWHDKFSRELTEDRSALSKITEAKNG